MCVVMMPVMVASVTDRHLFHGNDAALAAFVLKLNDGVSDVKFVALQLL